MSAVHKRLALVSDGVLDEHQTSVRLPANIGLQIRELALEFDLPVSRVICELLRVALEDSQ